MVAHEDWLFDRTLSSNRIGVQAPVAKNSAGGGLARRCVHRLRQLVSQSLLDGCRAVIRGQ